VMFAALADLIREKRVILFVGAGVSNTLGVPTWKALIEFMGKDLGYEPDLFLASELSYLTLAEYYKTEVGSIGPIRSWMDRHFNASRADIDKSEIYSLILQLEFPIIYTTNFDRNIETAFASRSVAHIKIVHVHDVTKINDGVTQIVKLHGDFTDDNTLVLTESSYFDRLSFESPLDIKLRSDALGKSLLFIGYSLTDINIRLLLYKLKKLWINSGYEKHQPGSYIFLPRPNIIQEAVLKQWGIQALTEDVDDPREALVVFLRKLAGHIKSPE
jgi:hypothetical protein